MRFCRTAQSLLMILAWLLSPLAATAQLSSCEAIRGYWQKQLPSDLYTRILDFRGAVEFLGQNPDKCAIYDVERVRWTYANSLDGFSRTFPNDAAATKSWANAAARQYQNYLEWIFSLSSSDLEKLIVAVTKQNPGTPEFDNVRRRWLRQRVGGALNSLGGVYELSKSYGTLVDTYANLASRCIDASTLCLQAFPLEVLMKWRKWLRSMPDFATRRSDSQIQELVKTDDDCLREWTAFRDFLEYYVPANPSIRAEWEPLQRRVTEWLAMSS